MDQWKQTTHRNSSLSLTDLELADRLGWFTHLRWVVGVVALLILMVSWHVLGMRFVINGREESVALAVQVILLVFLYNAAFAFIVHIIRAKGKISSGIIVKLALAQLACDMIAICAVAHYTGGVENFFVVLVVLPLVVATELLPQKLAYATAVIAALLINLLAWSEQQGWLSHVHISWPNQSIGLGKNLYTDPLYVLQFTASLTVTIFLTVFVAASISRRLRLREAELEETYDHLTRADEAKSFFMRKAGHELRAPLAAIHSILEAIVHTSDALEPQHRKLIARTQFRTAAMMAMVDELRRYSYLRSPESAMKLTECSLNDLVAGTVELFAAQAKKKGIELNASRVPIIVQGDEEMLREVVTNLISNAIQYTPPGGRIDVTLRRSPAEAQLTVVDTGIGLSPEAKENLFREFYRSPEARKLLPEG